MAASRWRKAHLPRNEIAKLNTLTTAIAIEITRHTLGRGCSPRFKMQGTARGGAQLGIWESIRKLAAAACSWRSFGVAGRRRDAPRPLAPAAAAPINVLTTITTFVSLAQAVGGDRVRVSSLVPIGASPEDYQPTPSDIERLHAADVSVRKRPRTRSVARPDDREREECKSAHRRPQRRLAAHRHQSASLDGSGVGARLRSQDARRASGSRPGRPARSTSGMRLSRTGSS